MKTLSLVLALLLITGYESTAQQFGGYPPSIKWKQINSDTARIIFSKGAELQASRIAALVHKAAADTTTALGKQLRKVNIVLHNQTTLANGYVGLAPFRSEFYLVPSSNVYDFGNLPWHENLAIHEYRHVQQYNNFRNGLSKAFYYLLGEQGQAFANAITIPDWFFEGDAVHSETALTEQGRGRLSYFLSGYNSLWLEGRNYNWQKLRNGSLKDFVPDHYQLGYLLVNYGYEKYGKEFWEKVTQDASRFKGLFYPFQKGIEKYSGVDFKEFRKQAFKYYQDQKVKYVRRMNIKKEKVKNYYFPQYIGNDSLLYMMSAYNKLTAFYLKDKNGEHRISQKSIGSEEWFSYNNGRIAYTAYSPNPRWSFIDYNDIVILDIKTGSEKRLTNKSKYFTPDYAPSGTKMVAVRVNDSLETELDILDSEKGTVLRTIKSDNGIYFSNPRFAGEDQVVAGLRTPDSKMSLQMLDLRTNQWEELIPPSSYSISLPFVKGDTVYFTANFYGNDDIYALNTRNKNLYQLTRRFTGTYFPSVHNDSLLFSFYTSNGLRIETMDVNKTLWATINKDSLKIERRMFPVAFENVINQARPERFATRRYDKSTGLFNFHSWSPSLGDPEVSFSLYGDNILNTFSNELFYTYNNNESSHAVGWNTAYAGLYPVINAGVEYTFHRSLKLLGIPLTFNQFEARIGYSLPYDFSKGKTYKSLEFGSNAVYNHSTATGYYKDSVEFEREIYLHHFANWAQYKPQARQHIYPKLGYTVSGAHRHLISDNGFQFLGGAQLFLPSIANHSIVVSGSFQETDTLSTVFTNRFSNARGYSDFYFSRMWKVGGNYHFPILYPDLGFASIVYLQRLRGNVFYDYSRVYSGDKTLSRNLRSTGFELFFDTKWWNQLPVSFGLRVSHLLDNGFDGNDRKGSNYFEFILPVNLIPD